MSRIFHPSESFVVLSDAGEEEDFWARWIGKFVEGRFGKSARHLAGAIGAEIVEDYGVFIANCSDRFAAAGFAGCDWFRHNNWLDEFISGAAIVAGANGGYWVDHTNPRVTVNHGAIGALDAFPAIIAIHRVVAADDAGNLPGLKFLQVVLQLIEKFRAAVRRSVASVHEAVDEDAFDFLFARQFQQREKMIDVRMNAAVAEQSD